MTMRMLVAARLIDGAGALPVTDAAVVIDDGRVAAAGPRAAICQRVLKGGAICVDR